MGDSRGRREKWQTEKDMAEELNQKEEERHKQKAEKVALGEWPTPVKWPAKSTLKVSILIDQTIHIISA